jgi:alpha-1,3/alpha-1,6-mannosyltransferase
LVLAGGYDERLEENRSYLKELFVLSEELGLKAILFSEYNNKPDPVDVVFLPSFSNEQRSFLLNYAACLVYTPREEHFGIVPVEAMYSKLPVVAVNSGGPTESIIHGKTGFLVESDEKEMANCIGNLLHGKVDLLKMGQTARSHVEDNFSLSKFGSTLASLL